MSRKFIARKEVAFINAINKELVQRVVGQEVYYYAVLADKTQMNDLYNEAITKVWAPPVKCNALVKYDNMNEVVGNLPPDSRYALDVHFHKQELDERNISPKMGDYIQFDGIMFEIYSVSEPQYMFGQIENKVMIRCNCGPARKGQFDPPKQPMPVTRHDLQSSKYPELPPNRAYTGDYRSKK